jgi:hypothetical protein
MGFHTASVTCLQDMARAMTWCEKQVQHCRYNNDERIAGSMAKSAVKLVYYYAFATLYGLAGGWANVRHPTVLPRVITLTLAPCSGCALLCVALDGHQNTRSRPLRCVREQAVMVNSTWTCDHIRQLFVALRRPRIVYPPCDTKRLRVQLHRACVCGWGLR